MRRIGTMLAGLLVGLGVAVFARTIDEVGVSRLAVGHILGPGLVLAGIARIKLQRMLDRPGSVRVQGPHESEEGGDGDG